MKDFIKDKLNESLTYSIIETLMGEEYPQSFNMDEFKRLSSFNARIQYCNQHLKRISSGSSRVVYMIDNEKVLKLAKNKKGLAQNEVEIDYSGYYDLAPILARVFDYSEDHLWVEMELAKKVTPKIFKQVTGLDFNGFSDALIYDHRERNPRKFGSFSFKKPDDMDLYWENEFGLDMLSFMSGYDIPAGDLTKLSTYGLVKRDGQDAIVIIDYGLTNDVYQNYYS